MKDVILLVFGFVSGVLVTAAFGEKVKAFVAGLQQIVRAWRVSLAAKVGPKG